MNPTAPMPVPDPSGALNELKHWYNRQKFVYPFAGYDSGLVVIPNNTPSVSGGTGRFTSSITTQADDFLVRRIWGFAYGPVNAQGLTNLASSGIATDFPNPINTNLAVHGVSVKITDTKTGRVWMNNPIPIELITPKGYANQSNAAFEFNWLLPGNSIVQLEWYNADTRAQPVTGNLQYHAAFLVLDGDRYNGLRLT
jgi:hypothetical protein